MTTAVSDRLEEEILIGHFMEKVEKELLSALSRYPSFNSAHEGFAVLKEEVDELWDEVKRKNDGSDEGRTKAMEKEGIQVAAMALRFLVDCT